MTKLAFSLTALGLAFAGTAYAQTAPADDTPTNTEPTNTEPTTSDDTTRTPDTTTTTAPSDTTTTTTPSDTTTTTQAPAPPTEVDVNVNTPPSNVNVTTPDVNVHTPDTVMTDTTPVEEEHYDNRPLSGIGIAIAAGGGASGFTNDTLRNSTDVGGDWDVRATIGTRSLLAFEASYIGSAQSIDALGLDTDAVLVGNGVQGALRLNGTIDFPVQPFIYAGIGWRRYDLTNTDVNLSDVEGSDDVMEVPMGVGLAGRWNGLIVDARGEFRAATNNDMVPEIRGTIGGTDDFAEMHRWGVKATVGMEF